MEDFKITTEVLSVSLVCFVTERFVSVKRLMELFGIDEDKAKAIISALVERNIISGYDFDSDGMPFISQKDFDSFFVSEPIKNVAGLGVDLLANLRKCFCFYSANVNIFTLEKEEEKPISKELQNKLKDLFKNGEYLTIADVQKKLRLPYTEAYQGAEWLTEQGFVTKCTAYKIGK